MIIFEEKKKKRGIKIMIEFPNAKINIGLNIRGKREDGYHEIETILYPIGLCDTLEIMRNDTGKTEMSITGIKIDGDAKDNLVMKTVEMIREEHEIPELKIHLRKNIPFEAGLGGGSSDAAMMAKMLNRQFALGMTEEEMTGKISRLGSDCAFFTVNRPCFATGRGEILKEIDLDLTGKRFILVKPKDAVSTKEAYSKLSHEELEAKRNNKTEKLTESIKRPITEWRDCIVNDFEESVFPNHPKIAEIKKKLYDDMGAEYASMSGSGSSVYGIFNENTDEEELRKEGRKVFDDLFVFCEVL